MAAKLAAQIADLPYRERLRSELFGLAKRIVAKDGLTALQARRLAKEAGCSVGSIYNVFGDLDGLIIAINTDTLARLGSRLSESARASAAADTQARLLDLALTYMRFALEHTASWKAIFEHRLATDREVPAEYRADQAQLLALIEHIITPEIAEARVRTSAARALFAAVHGIIALSVDHKLSKFDKAQMESEIRFIVRAAANGITAARAGV